MRTTELKIRMTPSEKETLRVEAAKAGICMADYLRFCSLGKAGLKANVIPYPEHYDSIMQAVVPISNNVNQIAKWLNTYRDRIEDPELYGKVEGMLEQLRTFDADLRKRIMW